MFDFSLTPNERAEWRQVEGVVFDVQRFSVHDGPGLRTNVFIKGCPLRCGWCANPESQQMPPELALSEQNCMTCGQFEEPCPVCWARDNGADELHPRVDICPTGAIHWLGERRTAGDIIDEVLRDLPFYQQGGGLTLTGGEPTMQPALAEALLRLAKDEHISTAMETCGHTQWDTLEPLLPYLDDILYDVKHLNSQTHRAHTGLGNELILANLRRLAARESPAITVRVPLIPGFNASSETVRAIADFVRPLGHTIKAIDLLPYHTLGRAKYQALGREYPWANHRRLSDEKVAALAELVAGYGLKVKIGSQ